MIVRAMTSESGEMCNLEDVRTWPSKDTRLSQRMSSSSSTGTVGLNLPFFFGK